MKLSRPIVYTLVGAVAVAYFYLGDDTAAPNKLARKKPKPAATKGEDQWLADDYSANQDGKRFMQVNEPVRNSFRPLVIRNTTDRSVVVDPMTVPPGIAGEPGWVYTGMAEVDGVPQALLENSQSQDGVFLKQGEKWKGATVYQIKPDTLVLMDRSGVLQSVKVNVQETTPGFASPGSGFQPVTPPLRGNIGGGLAIRPDRTAIAKSPGGNRNPAQVDQSTGVGDEN